ncbi:polyribonucleotide nucleotidyltransferase [Entomospira culicis]|uniref:Polyribonucleotide nucleotidyltransferase n=1 Tax=Entomospira culicis TaxID=2719989 RepID=A0A968GEB0_9SPIO|nr:polyribonucleotide nucleotidyltransferase [Entomospira culicis]NIZ18728.1 polyribonucleotide nucleotidyltransferase [Entomospira culicis]NIZ68943.1 polyribonucleotide nucleotidyltransferase [Entomospira culicis]WDI37535.1 polyribonucleotide nucleotidyltransferase [Entomospira culicis]WDI39163.1 polyribonucleotide nucleotidyltransferase [Entomospira culicis]
MERAVFKIGQHDLILETGKMGRQANGAVFAKYAGVAVFATICCSSEAGEPLDYVPVSVEYNEKYYAAGKIPGGFLKREARPKDKEILVSRLIDRPMRPLFYKEFGRDIQVIPTVVSADQIHTPDVIGMIAAFAAVQISDIPFNGPVAAIRVASLDGNFIINPTFEEIEKADLDIVVASNPEGICMVEGGAKEVGEEIMLAAIAHAEEFLAKLLQFLREFGERAGKAKLPLPTAKSALPEEADIIAFAKPQLAHAVFVKGKQARHEAIDAAKAAAKEKFASEYDEESLGKLSSLLENIERDVVRESILEKGMRTDGRSTTDIRDIYCDIGLLQRAHGSALFTRGETQSLGVATLGSTFDEQIMDNIDGDTRSRFMLHYNFPPFSVGETGRLSTGRREIGHGHLAQRALEPIIPSKEAFPYTIRVVSEILESNGSSSQATICSGSMALLHAGVPIKSSVAGIAMGLIKEGDRFAILSDILGEEDHLGDMDFKVAGSDKGITAFQMDIKCPGITIEIMRQSLAQAHAGRKHILKIMNESISEPGTPSEFAPSIESFKVEIDKIGAIIGPGGKNIKAIADSSQSKINIEDDGTVTIAAKTKEQGQQARSYIMGLVSDPEVGVVYQGTVKRLMEFGAFIEILPGKEGLCHISKLSKKRVEKVSDVVKEGDVVKVKLVEIDKMGRLNLSMSDV